MACVLSQSTLIRLQVVLQGNCLIRALGCVHLPGLSRSGSGSWVLHKGTDLVGPAFCALPSSEQLRRPGTFQAHIPQVWCILSLSPSDHLGFLSSQWERRLRCAVCLFWVSDLWPQPSRWMSTVQDPRKTWLATGNLLSVWQRMPSLGPRLPLSGCGCHPPGSLPLVGDGQSTAGQFSSGIHSVLFSVSGPSSQVRAFCRKVLSLSFLSVSGYLTVWVPVSPQLPQIALRAFRPGPYPKQCSPQLPVQPPLAGGGCERLGYFSPGSYCQARNLWVLFMYLFFILVMLPSEIPRLPTDPLVRGFPVVWKFLLFYDSLPGWVSIPNYFVSLFIFYILSYFLSKTMGCISGCLVSSSCIQKLFCGICSVFKCSFDEFVGEKVVSLSYSSVHLMATPST